MNRRLTACEQQGQQGKYPHLVFVYGSLRSGQDNSYLLDGSIRAAQSCYVEGRMYDTGLGYPAITLEGRVKVYGELYRVTDETLRRLDELEDYYGEGMDNDYDRVIQTVYTDQGPVQASIYIYSEAKARGLRDIPSGDWCCDRT